MNIIIRFIINQGKIYMRGISLILLMIYYSYAFKDCNFSQFDFISRYSLGKQDELNMTFAIVNKKMDITKQNVSFQDDKKNLYKIFDSVAKYTYIDSKQRAQVVGLDIIYIKGGVAQVSVNYDWSKNGRNGLGTAVCYADSISFAKLLYFSQGFLVFKLSDYSNLTFYTQNCKIIRTLPSLPDQDIIVFQNLLNNNDGDNMKTILSLQTAKYYPTALNQSLYDERQPINNHSQYTWLDPSKEKNLTINYTLLPTGAHLNKNGLSLNFVTEISNDDNWKCGASVPSQAKETDIYGGIQEFLSLSILQNTIRYSIQKGALNSILNQQKWQSKVFSFNVGDLYEIIPILTSKYYAATEIQGSCNTTTKDIQIDIVDNQTFAFSLRYDCQLNIQQTRILTFDIDLTLNVQIRPQEDYLDFFVVKMKKFTHFKDQGIYKIHDLDLAGLFLTRSLQRLYQGPVFGSGWKIYSRDYPKIALQNGFLFIYDAASIMK